MAKIIYKSINFRAATLELIEMCDSILMSYAEQGFTMTLRQLYYQLVARDLIPNNQKEYDRLGRIVSDARRAGLLDWDSIVDRTRNLKSLSHWSSPGEIVDAVAEQYLTDKWASQSFRPEVWIEKDALVGVFEQVCQSFDVPFFSCRGYSSDSEMWSAAQRLMAWEEKGQTPFILHFGDHDPSGIDMSRDIFERLALFSGFPIEVKRLALNMPQIEQHNPPPNPAKLTDSRANEYIKKFGGNSWELDALNPEILSNLVATNIKSLIDRNAWREAEEIERKQRSVLQKISRNFPQVTKYVEQSL